MNKKLLLLIAIFFSFILGYGQTQQITTAGAGTFIVPCDVTSITVQAWGGGGAGGGTNTNKSKGGGGGAGGSYVSSVLSVTPGQLINYNVGAGAAGSREAGTSGEGSWFFNNTTIFAQGGVGGSAPNGGTVSGGVGSISSSFGDLKIPGANGNNGTSTVGGKGGNGGSSGGNGGAATTNEGIGNSGNQPGGGGGGAFVPDKTNHSGGNGGNGQINIIYSSSFKAYCTPSYNNAVEPITNVIFAGINNTTTNTTGGASLEIFCSPSASVMQGSAINAISVKGNTVGNYTEYIKAYVDWDQNGVFGNSANEIFDLGTITNSTGIDAQFTSGNIAVPSTAIIGSTMMRVVKTYFSNGVNSNNPCFSGNDWGQAEDYIVNVISPFPVITSLGAASGCVGTSITINGTNLMGATATTVKIGGTAVTSITSISATQIVAVIGNGTTGDVTVTTPNGTATSSSSFSVNLPSVGGTVSGGTTVCSGINSTVLTLSGHTGGVVSWESSLDNFATAASTITNTSTTLTVMNLSAITSYRAVLQSGSCSIANSSSATVTVNPSSIGGTVSGGTTVCSGINSAVLTLSGHTGAVVRWESSLDNFTTAASTIANTSTTLTVTNLSATTSYRAILQSGECAVATSGTVTVMVETNTWKVILGVAQWEKGTPNINQSIVFEANYNQNVNLEGCSCEVKSGNVTIVSGRTMTLTNELNIAGGTMKFENNASLVQINDVANTGNITYQRETVTPVDKFDYTYWSSPVSAQTLYNASPNTLWDKYMSFDAVNNNWIQENSSKVMDRGVGYIIRGPQNHYAPNPIGTYRANFIGVPHNGTIPVSIAATGEASYLLGNPYPSALDADLFLQVNEDVLDGTLYFWTHNTDIAPSGSNYIYDSDDYASYNLLGGVGTAAASDVNPIPTIPSGEIASGQGFFATSIVPGMVNFTNTMRLIGNVNSQFFRSNSKSKKNASFDKNRLWLNFSNTEGAFKQTLIGYISGATNEYERTFDGISFDGNTFVDFYSVYEDKNFVIQGRALPFLPSDQVPLGYRTTIAGKFTITIFQTDGFLTAQNVFLEDKILGVIHNLKQSSYSFTTEKGVFNERFVLRYTDRALGTGDFESQEKTIVVFKEKNELKIKSEFETMKRVTVFDLLGKKVFEETLKDVNEFRTSNITLKNQIVIIKVVLANGQVVAKKVSY